MNKQKNNKIVKYRNGPVFNIGTVLFGVIFIYMIICLVMYVTTDHITAYEVTAGPLRKLPLQRPGAPLRDHYQCGSCRKCELLCP